MNDCPHAGEWAPVPLRKYRVRPCALLLRGHATEAMCVGCKQSEDDPRLSGLLAAAEAGGRTAEDVGRRRRRMPSRAHYERRAVCATCDQRDESRGGLHCNLCRVCGDREPWRARSRCPVFKWRDAEKMIEAPRARGFLLEDDALELVQRHAKGRALEFGSGSGRGTAALLATCSSVVSVDGSEEWANAARVAVPNPRAEFFHCKVRAGRYDLSAVRGTFDTVLVDGPVGTKARAASYPDAWERLRGGGILLADDGVRDAEALEAFAKSVGLSVETLPTRKGLAVIRKPGSRETPSVTVCVNTQNEGPRVAETFRQMLRAFGPGAKGIAVDDASTDGCCENLPEGVLVLRNDERIGCGRSKCRAAEAADTDVAVFCDAHFMHVCGDPMVLAELAVEKQAIVCPVLRTIEYDEEWNPRVYTETRTVGDSRHLGIGWHCTKALSSDEKEPFQSLMVTPAIVVVPMNVLRDRLGGWNAYEARYGSQERGISLRAFMADVPILTVPAVEMGHEFGTKTSASRARWPYPPHRPSEVDKATWHAFAVVLEPDSFDRHVRPHLLRTHPRGEGIQNSDRVVREREVFYNRHKRRADGELLAAIEFGS